MNYIVINLPTILAATAAGLAIGFLYARFAKGRFSAGFRGRAALGLVLVAALAEFWLAAILAGALILAPPEAGPWTMALGSAIVIWIGFVVPVLATSYLFREIRLRTLLLDAFHWFVVMVSQAALLHVGGLVHP